MNDMTDNHTAFFYGTLMSPEVLYRVIYGTISPDPWQKERLAIQQALLHGYQRRRVKNEDYPAIFPLERNVQPGDPESQRVLGVLVCGLSDMDISRLDIFEGDQYDRKHVEVHPIRPDTEPKIGIDSLGQSIQAETYIWKPEHLTQLHSEEWDYEEFRKEKLKYWAGAEVMREDFDDVDAAVAEHAKHDGTGGRGAGGFITRQLSNIQRKDERDEPLKSAV